MEVTIRRLNKVQTGIIVVEEEEPHTAYAIAVTRDNEVRVQRFIDGKRVWDRSLDASTGRASTRKK